MHDPLTVAFEIRRPWPRRQQRDASSRRWQVRYPWRKWWDVRPGTFCAYWIIAGRTYYFGPLVTVWHRDPADRDCLQSGRPHWRWHVQHWRLQVVPLQAARRWLLTRCEWCGGPSRKGDLVNVSHQWDMPRAPWWRGERGLFHRDCSSIAIAHRTCVCGVGPWDNELGGQPYGNCVSCGRVRGWSKSSPHPAAVEATRLNQSIPHGQRDPQKIAAARRLWDLARAEREVNR